MSVLALILGAGLVGPDPAPLNDAVKTCDRVAMTAQTQAEPGRRAAFAMGVYAEQRAIALERAALDVDVPANTPAAAGQASLNTARVALDARQRRLDDAIRVERAWRELNEELRAQFLAACTGRKGNG